MENGELYDALVGLLEGQFQEVLFRSGIPSRFLSSSQTDRATRVTEIIGWANQTPDNRQVLLRAVMGVARPSAPAVASVATSADGSTGAPLGTETGSEAATTADAVFRSVRNRLPRIYGDLDVSSADDRQKHNSVIRHLVDERWTGDDNLLATLAKSLNRTRNRYPLRIDGQPGSGKSTLLALLYLTLEQAFRDNPDAASIPFLIDLSHYESADREGLDRLEQHLSILTDYLRQDSARSAILLVDGIDEYVAGTEGLQQRLVNFLSNSSAIRKVVAVGLNYDRDAILAPPKLSEDGTSAESVTLSAVPTGSCEPLVRAYVALRNREASAAVALLAIIERLRLFELDLMTLAMLEAKLPRLKPRVAGGHSGKLVPPYDKVTTLTDLYVVFCREKLGKHRLAQAAELAFTIALIESATIPEQLRAGPVWRLLHWHPTIRNFLVAWHVVVQLRSQNLTDEQLDVLNYVYPKQTSHFSKDLVSFTPSSEAEFLTQASAYFPRAKSKLRSHMAYLLGRIRSRREWARQILREWNKTADALCEAPTASTHDLLLARTIYISLAYLEDPGAQETYISRMLANKRWNGLNRGFHLEYFGDITWNPRDPEGLMAHEDNGGPWSTTKEALLDKLARGKTNPLYQLDLFTLVSLAQRRLGTCDLSDSDRAQIQQIAERSINAPEVRSEALQDYLRVMSWHLKNAQHSPISVLEVIYRIKHLKRRGWVKRELPVSETVGSHSFAAALLASILLPNKTSSPNYDKAMIVNMLMVHDLAEAIAGDSLPDEDVPAAREREARAYRLLATCATYDGIESLNEWERLFAVFTAESEENARIARDFDRLDNLIQLWLFRDHFNDRGGFDDFLKDLHNKIRTPEGQRCRDLVAQYFARHAELSGWLRDLDAWAERKP